MSMDVHPARLAGLLGFLMRLPAVEPSDAPSAAGEEADGAWWVRFAVDVDHELAWHTVQELAAVLNSLSPDERLASILKPLSPPPYLSGGPEECLSWIIEGAPELEPDVVAAALEARLPQPVEDETAWFGETEEEFEEDDLETDDDDGDDEDDTTGLSQA